jgi:hypothetical protein
MSDSDPSVVVRASLPDDGQLVDFKTRSNSHPILIATRVSIVIFRHNQRQVRSVRRESIYCQKSGLEHSQACVGVANRVVKALMPVDLRRLAGSLNIPRGEQAEEPSAAE